MGRHRPGRVAAPSHITIGRVAPRPVLDDTRMAGSTVQPRGDGRTAVSLGCSSPRHEARLRRSPGRGCRRGPRGMGVAKPRQIRAVDAVEEGGGFLWREEGGFPELTTCFGPRTELVGLNGRTCPTTRQSKSIRSAARCWLTVAGERSCVSSSTQAAATTGSTWSRARPRRSHHVANCGQAPLRPRYGRSVRAEPFGERLGLVGEEDGAAPAEGDPSGVGPPEGPRGPGMSALAGRSGSR